MTSKQSISGQNGEIVVKPGELAESIEVSVAGSKETLLQAGLPGKF